MKDYSLESRFPRKRLLSGVLIATVVVLYAVLPLVGSNESAHSPGPLSSGHQLLEKNCSACHVSSFQPIDDETCLQCHKLSDHGSTQSSVHHNALAERSCISCHTEHHGNRSLIADDSKLCAQCHASISAVSSESKLQSVSNWNNHPEIRIGDARALVKGAVDRTNLKLNHKVHLQPGIQGDKGKETLQCSSCHVIGEKGIMRPIEFETSCQRCHELGFEENSDLQSPHAKPDEVFQFLYGTYSQRAVRGEGEVSQPPERQRPGKTPRITSTLVSKRPEVEAAARQAEELLFMKTACIVCHSVTQKASIDPSQKASRYEMANPEVPIQWMPKAKFSHVAHEVVDCTECHGDVRASTQTSDVLLPSITTCQDCHGEKHTVGAQCVMCHDFHNPLPLPHDQLKKLHELVNKK